MASSLPPLPDGFTLDQPQAMPPLPQGFTLDAPQQPQRSVIGDLGHQLALTGRGAAEGVADMAAIPANALATVLNLGLAAYDKMRSPTTSELVTGKQPSYRFPEQSQHFSNLLDAAGVAKPENDVERFSNNVVRRVAGTAATMGTGAALSAAPGVTGQVGTTLASNPVVQGASAFTGPAAAEVAKQAGAGPLGQGIADFVGSAAPGVVATVAPEITRRGFRGGEEGRQNVADNIRTFKAVGTTPTVGQATEGRAAQATESLLAKTPGGAGVMADKATTQASDIGAALERQAAQLSPQASGEQAGKAIVKGISGDGGFVDAFKAKQGELYDKLDQFIPKDSPVDVTKTRDALAALNADIPGAPNISEFFKNSKIKGIQGALESDVSQNKAYTPSQLAEAQSKSGNLDELNAALQQGRLPYEAVKKLRTLVGNEMADSWVGSDVPRSKWKPLYGALTEDLKGAAAEAGPEAQSAWSRANNYSRAGMNRIDALSSVIEKNGGPEKIFQAATAGTKEGDTTIRAVMQSLPPDAQKTLAATIVRRLGAAKSGAQNYLGDKFSTESLLTNWNNISPEAKRVLFDRFGAKFRNNMDQVAKVASNLRTGSKVFVNPSGTAQATIQQTTVAGFALAVLSGQYGTAGAIAAGAAGANLSARLMTNPRFVGWLATATKAPIGAKSALINSLAGNADPDLKEAARVLQESQDQQPQRNQGRN